MKLKIFKRIIIIAMLILAGVLGTTVDNLFILCLYSLLFGMVSTYIILFDDINIQLKELLKK